MLLCSAALILIVALRETFFPAYTGTMVTLKDANSIRSGTVDLSTCLLRAPKAGFACSGDKKRKPVHIRNDGKAAEDCYEQRDAWLCLPALVWFGEGVRLLYQIIDATEKPISLPCSRHQTMFISWLG